MPSRGVDMGKGVEDELKNDGLVAGLFQEQPPESEAVDGQAPRPRAFRPSGRFADRGQVTGIQDLLWKEGLHALHAAESFQDDTAFVEHLRTSLPQNSDVTRRRYTVSLMRWFFPDGVRGLAAKVWFSYRDPSLAEAILRYLYLRAEPMVGTVVADGLFGIAENSVVPDRYITECVRRRFGENTPAKSIERVKTNLRKLGILVREKSKDVLRPPSSSATGFLIVLHHIFASGESRGVEFRAVKDNLFWKYLGLQSEDKLREILREALARNLIAKYVVADQIESISFRYSFDEFVEGRHRL